MDGKPCLLVVIPDTQRRELLAESCRSLGQVLTANGLETAIQYFEVYHLEIKLVVTDLVSCQPQGEGFIEWLRTVDQHLPIIVVPEHLSHPELPRILTLPRLFFIYGALDPAPVIALAAQILPGWDGDQPTASGEGFSVRSSQTYSYQGDTMPKETILVVDDSPIELRLVTNLLTNQGYRVVTASDGEEAVAKAVQEKPDLIVLDVVMPKQNGFEACRAIKATPGIKDVKVIILTSKNQRSDKFWGMSLGADEYLTKPFQDQDLLSAITKHL